ncbi:hypothetical protein pdam_00018047, partial [Pocillopora damicornis]
LSFLFDINDRLLNATGLYEPPLPPMVRQRVILKETFHYLHAPSIGTLAAHDVFDCTFECLSNPLCSSLNLASSKRADGTLLCEFLSSDRYRNPKEYRRNQSSHHLYFKSPCSSYPCQNAGACGTNNRYDTFECFCENGFTGKYCEKGNTVEHISNEYITISLPTNYKNLTK